MDTTLSLPKSLMTQLVEQMKSCVQEQLVDAVSLEECVRAAMHQLGGMLLEALADSMEERYPPETVPCGCGCRAHRHSKREAVLLTVYGRIHYHRTYYICPHCHRGQCPLDDRLGLRPGQVSVKLGSLLAILGSQMSYREASRMAKQLFLLDCE